MSHFIRNETAFIWTWKNKIFYYNWKDDLECKNFALPDIEIKPGNENKELFIDCMNFSSSGEKLVICDNQKRLLVYGKDCDYGWKIINSWFVNKRCTKVHFDNEEKLIVTSDRSGDVYKFDINGKYDSCIATHPISGHLSMLLDMVITENNKFIITSDRDEKIRISHFPNTHIIERFCLGHEEFVSCLCVMNTSKNILISGSGDGTIKIWNYISGKEVSSRHLKADFASKFNSNSIKDPDESKYCESSDKYLAIKSMRYDAASSVLAVTCDNINCVCLYSVQLISDENVTIEFICCLEVASVNLCFDDESNLWIVSGGERLRINVFSPVHDGKIINYQPLDENRNSLRTKIESFRKDLDSIEDTTLEEEDLNKFYKHWFDNVKDYLEKKQLRMNKKSKKFKKMSGEETSTMQLDVSNSS